MRCFYTEGASSKNIANLENDLNLDLDALLRENLEISDASNPYSYGDGERDRERVREKAKTCLRAFMITKIILDANPHILLDQILRADEDAGTFSWNVSFTVGVSAMNNPFPSLSPFFRTHM